MLESLLILLGCPPALTMDQSFMAVLDVALLTATMAMLLGIGIAERLVGPKGSRGLQAGCRLHEWIRLDDGHFICLRCSYRAGSSRQPAATPPRPH